MLFAFNADTDYVAIADKTSKLIRYHLNLPITLITDPDAVPKFDYDNVIRVDAESGNIKLDVEFNQVTWKNFGRYLAYELSPYDTTILLDVDYLVLDDSLLTLLTLDKDYLFHYSSNTSKGEFYPLMGERSLPFIWATAVIFKKCDKTQMLFELVGRIQRNYNYYRMLYNIRERNYRNDYAFAIANIMLNGYTIDTANSIPWPLLTLEEPITAINLVNNQVHIRGREKGLVVTKQNIHIMDKKYLETEQFKEFVESVCEN